MKYTIQKLANLAGVSSRTLRYYDEIGLLKPASMTSSGYRMYGDHEVNQLQHILFYRELGVSLEDIKNILTDPSFDSLQALKEHRNKLVAKQEQLDQLLTNVEKTIAQHERRIPMSDNEKFEGFKEKWIEENERKYGKEIRTTYGDTQIDTSNAKIREMTAEQHARVQQLERDILSTLHEAVATGDPTSPLAQKTVELHREWLSYYWSSYTKEAHAGLAQLYVNDERFTEYYDREQPGATAFLRDAIVHYTK
ncbi:MerR family transcriptional regulator [Bacillus alkalicellulosilyticus]|uniref:MerR family transcriptional regulator n=1 Tax=Alkalihalobacterium alkalicellulosilyticum TaxID=1912214 RepID=UPI00099630DB|nr:MerR family transcriptional regulator [Bacillus alkalicellulosilyticus]